MVKQQKYTGEIGEYETFVKEVFVVGGSLAITIPATNVEFSGIKAGDWIKVMYKKIEKNEGDVDEKRGTD